jgi:hypothetical protein
VPETYTEYVIAGRDEFGGGLTKITAKQDHALIKVGIQGGYEQPEALITPGQCRIFAKMLTDLAATVEATVEAGTDA